MEKGPEGELSLPICSRKFVIASQRADIHVAMLEFVVHFCGFAKYVLNELLVRHIDGVWEQYLTE